MIDDINRPSFAFVIPCLNEEKTLPLVLDKIKKVCSRELKSFNTEIIVSDNGSTDRSVETAISKEVKVVHCAENGYGAAINFGVLNTNADYVIFADADDTYDFRESSKFVNEALKGVDLIIGNRLNDVVSRKAMPFLHRRVGTPTLNFIINFLYGKKDNKIYDCNSGFRCFRRESFLKWNIKSTGMEFASEMLAKALKHNARISHVPVKLHQDLPGRVPHLKTWRDGMRHLLQIISEAPEFFFKVSRSLFTASFTGIIISLFWGPLNIMGFSVFGIHTMLLLFLLAVFSVTLFGIGLGLSVKTQSSVKLYNLIMSLPEDKLFWMSLVIFIVSLGFFIGLLIYWGTKGFSNIDLTRETVFFVVLGTIGIQLISSIIFAHLIKRGL